MFIAKSPVLSCFSMGLTTSLIFDSGENNTYAVPIHDGYINQRTVFKSKVAGNMITEGLQKYLKSQSIEIHPESILVEEDSEMEKRKLEVGDFTDSAYKFHINRILKNIKHKVLECNLEPIAKRDPSYEFESKKYTLPDGISIDFSGDQFKIPEILFISDGNKNEESKKNEGDGDAEMIDDDPYAQKLQGFNGFQNLLYKAVNAADLDIRRDLYKHILCTGGNTQLKNFEERFVKDVEEVAPQNCPVNFMKKRKSRFNEEGHYTSFIGASILSSLSSFENMWFSRKEYEENGAYLIEEKCP